MSVLPTGLAKSLAEDYTIDQSLRFEPTDSPSLARTPTVEGNRKTWTFSFWYKCVDPDFPGDRDILSSTTAASPNLEHWVRFGVRGTNNQLVLTAGYSYNVYATDAFFRDVGAWYHIVLRVDTTQASFDDRWRIYVNGDLKTLTNVYTDTSGVPPQNQVTAINSTDKQELMVYSYGTDVFTPGYLAEVYMIDGTSLAPSSFAETDDTTNQWKPIDASDLTFGTNGFYQKYAATELANSFTDSAEQTITAFTSTGSTTWTVPAGITSVDVLVVGGGGGGACQGDGGAGGSGGGGGLVYKTGHTVTPGESITVTVGLGGTNASSNYGAGGTGGDSVFDTLTAKGGGAGKTNSGGGGHAGGDGGSGGGGGWTGGAGGSETQTGQSGDSGTYGFGNDGHAGGTPGGAGNQRGGAGGGAGGAGQNGSGNAGGTGGAGKEIAAFSDYGDGGYFAGGGGAGGYTTGGTGGTGGGGAGGGYSGDGGAGDANTGGGGGGTYFGSSGVGGTGVVLIKHSGAPPRHTITANGDVANTRTQLYKSQSFTTPGANTWTCPADVTSVEVLVVAGGGGGGGNNANNGGGGGGGGLLEDASYTVVPGTVYDITVGAGGAGGDTSDVNGANGSDSVWNVNAEGSGATQTAVGGGGGGTLRSSDNGAGSDGGSGGGGSHYGSGGAGGSATQGDSGGGTGYGYAGGSGYTGGGTNDQGGGGGGAGAVGANGASSDPGDGGAGRANTITGASVTYAGGGGGGSRSVAGAAGGSGGGGAGGAASANGTDGTANTGGGGGGAGDGSTTGGDGGSGIVILKYVDTEVPGWPSSIAFDGTGDYLSIPTSSDFDFGTGDFTMEFWFYMETIASQPLRVLEKGDNADTSKIQFGAAIYNDGVHDRSFLFRVGNGTTTVSLYTSDDSIQDDTWYHIAMVRDGDDFELFLDGVSEDTASSAGFDVLNSSDALWIGSWGYSNDFNGYMDEIRFSNTARYTSAFTPSTTQFTADANTILLIHSDFDGGLGADSSGNYNDFSVTNLVATDQMKDSPTNNFCTFNSAIKHDSPAVTISEGNLRLYEATGSTWAGGVGTIGLSSGKWYWESLIIDTGAYLQQGICSNVSVAALGGGSSPQESSGTVLYYSATGNKILSGTDLGTYGATYGDGDIIGTALNLDDSEITFYKNNSSQGTISFPADITSSSTVMPFTGIYSSRAQYNFGSDSSFSGDVTAQGNADGNGIGDFYYEPPSGYLALCTDNLSDPEIKLPGDNFNTLLWTGDGAASRSITGLGFQADMMWSKIRSDTHQHNLVDTVRGVDQRLLMPNLTNSEDTTCTHGWFDSLDSDGWSMTYAGGGWNVNTSSETYVGWGWLGANGTATNENGDHTSTVSVNSAAGFSIVSYTGTFAAATVGHGLSQKPELIIAKNRSASHAWTVGADVIDAAWEEKMLLSDDAAKSATNDWNDTVPTATVFSVGVDSPRSNGDGNDMIAYCFHSVEGYSKVGSYTGNGNDDGPFVYLGFRPAFTLVKRVDTAENWWLEDDKRNTYNPQSKLLYADLSNAEATEANKDYVSNGMKMRLNNANWNASGGTYLYYAVADYPFKYSPAR